MLTFGCRRSARQVLPVRQGHALKELGKRGLDRQLLSCLLTSVVNVTEFEFRLKTEFDWGLEGRLGLFLGHGHGHLVFIVLGLCLEMRHHKVARVNCLLFGSPHPVPVGALHTIRSLHHTWHFTIHNFTALHLHYVKLYVTITKQIFRENTGISTTEEGTRQLAQQAQRAPWPRGSCEGLTLR